MILREQKILKVPEITTEQVLMTLLHSDRKNKINAIREVRDIYHLGLKDSKDLVVQGWAFLDVLTRLQFPVLESELLADVNENTIAYYDSEPFNREAYEQDAIEAREDDLPW